MNETTHREHPPVMPFGKWKGSCPDAVAHADPDYVAWLLSEEWFAEEYPQYHDFFRTLGIKPKTRCAGTWSTGPCQHWTKYGPLCGKHYRQAEHALAKAMAAMEWDTA